MDLEGIALWKTKPIENNLVVATDQWPQPFWHLGASFLEENLPWMGRDGAGVM